MSMPCRGALPADDAAGRLLDGGAEAAEQRKGFPIPLGGGGVQPGEGDLPAQGPGGQQKGGLRPVAFHRRVQGAR